MAQEDAGAVVLRFPLERRLAAIQAEADAQNAAQRLDEAVASYRLTGQPANVEYTQEPGWFGVRIRPTGGTIPFSFVTVNGSVSWTPPSSEP